MQNKNTTKQIYIIIASVIGVFLILCAVLYGGIYIYIQNASKELNTDLIYTDKSPDGERIYQNTEGIKFEFLYNSNYASPKLFPSDKDFVMVDIYGDKNEEKELGLVVHVVSTNYVKSTVPYLSENYSQQDFLQAISAVTVVGQCDYSYTKFEMVPQNLFPTKEVYFSSKPDNTCSFPFQEKPYNYPIAEYIVKLSDEYYLVVQTSKVNDLTDAIVIVKSAKLN